MLGFAIENNQQNIVKFLLKKGADPEAYFGHRWTALGYAIEADAVDIVRLLLLHKADPEHLFGMGDEWSPLTYSVSLQRLEIIKYLLDGGAKISGKKGDAMEVAGAKNLTDALEVLETHKPNHKNLKDNHPRVEFSTSR